MTNEHSSVLIRKPLKPIDATLTIPGSKSITNRMLIATALADGESVIRNASRSDDTTLLTNALNKAGISVNLVTGGSFCKRPKVLYGRISGRLPGNGVKNNNEDALSIYGRGGIIPKDSGHFFLGNAGTSLRFITSFLSLGKGHFVVDGNKRMRERPILELIDALNKLGANIKCTNGNGCPPINITADGLRGGEISIKGNISSQFISSLLLVAPYTKEGISLRLNRDTVSKPYIDMTIDIINAFGVKVEREGYNTFTIKKGQRYRTGTYYVDSDASSANYFFAIAAVTEGKILIEHMGNNYTQGESKFVDVLKKMGCTVIKSTDYIEVIGGKLRGIDIDMNDMPDSVQTLACVSLFADSPTTIRNIANLRLKETDRVDALYNELRKVGAVVEKLENSIRIIPAKGYASAAIETYNDHRMVMSFAIAAAIIDGLVIKNPNCVSKSFPNFFSLLEKIGFTMEFR